jgi:hypothetical protein
MASAKYWCVSIETQSIGVCVDTNTKNNKTFLAVLPVPLAGLELRFKAGALPF